MKFVIRGHAGRLVLSPVAARMSSTILAVFSQVPGAKWNWPMVPQPRHTTYGSAKPPRPFSMIATVCTR
jgi:hypothetical protein